MLNEAQAIGLQTCKQMSPTVKLLILFETYASYFKHVSELQKARLMISTSPDCCWSKTSNRLQV